jgi:hypothetical protein
VATPSDQPGWRPDPEQPGMVRWWNGLDWSETRRRADDGIVRARQAADDAARGSTISPEQVTKASTTRSPLKAASDAVVSPALSATNPFAAGAVAVGVIGLLFGALGVLPAVGLVVSILGLVRSRRLARDGRRNTGFGQSVAGLVLSLLGLLRLLLPLAPLLNGLFNS